MATLIPCGPQKVYLENVDTEDAGIWVLHLAWYPSF